MKKIFYVLSFVLCLSACGEKAEEKVFLDKNVKNFLEYNDIAGVTSRMQLPSILTKMIEVKMHIQDYKFSKNCQSSVEYLVENMDTILDMYKNFSLEKADSLDYINGNMAKKAIEETLEYRSCHNLMAVVDKRRYVVEQNRLLLDEISKKEPNIQLIAQYIYNGADVNTRNVNGSTALTFAIINGIYGENPQALEIIKILIENGADVNTKDADGFTALMMAFTSDSPQVLDIVKLLIENGADINAKDTGGATVLMHASISKNPRKEEIIKLLKEHGAK